MSNLLIWWPANDDGCRFSHHRRQRATNYIKIREVDRNKLITTFIYDLVWYYFIRDLARHHGRVARTFDRAEPSTPRRWRGGRLGHHGRGVLPVFSCCGWLSHLSYVEKWYETAVRLLFNNVTLCSTLACTTPLRE
jgi:hypothetical protein